MASGRRIATGTGDRGETSLGDGRRVAKTDPRMNACGDLDELNCLLGLARVETLPAGLDADLERLQRDLFVLGADLATPPEAAGQRIGDAQLQWVEARLDGVGRRLQPLGHFILPGGNRAAATLHLARAVARRAERSALRIADRPAAGAVQTYLNRLSDLLFLWARLCNEGGGDHASMALPEWEAGP